MGQEEEKKNQETTGTGDKDLKDLKAEALGDDGGQPASGVEKENPAYPTDPRLLATFWKVQFRIIARRAGDHWQLSDEEAAQLGELSVPVVDKWLPAVMTKFGAEFMLAGALIMVAVDRIGKGNAKKEGNIDDHRTAGSGEDNAS